MLGWNHSLLNGLFERNRDMRRWRRGILVEIQLVKPVNLLVLMSSISLE
jgi:hypothetical protein